MNNILPRRNVLRFGLALGAAPWVASSQACEFFAPNFTVVHPWTRASRDGETVAIVCMKFQDVTETDRLIGAHTPVAEGAELGGQVAAPAMNFVIHEGQTTVFDVAGVHLRLVGLKFPLQIARTYPMSLVFAKAGELRVDLNVDYARFA